MVKKNRHSEIMMSWLECIVSFVLVTCFEKKVSE